MRLEGEPEHVAPSAEEIREALARIAASEEFRSSPQLLAFLTFVVEAALGGESDRVKAYTIGVEAFGRGSSFDPQTDPIVRVEATRLRRTMERYYGGTGRSAPLVIELSRGNYVPGFRYRRVLAAGAPEHNESRRDIPRGRWLLPPVALALLIAIAFLGPKVRLDWSSGSSATSATPAPHERSALPVGNGMPTLLVQPFEVAGTPEPQGISAPSLHDSLSDAFSKFDLVNIIWEPMLSGADSTRTTSATRAPVDYSFTGTVEYAPGTMHISFRLTDTAQGMVIWSRTFDERAVEGRARASEEAIVRELTSTLVQPFGVIYAHGRRQASARGAGDPRYRCLLETIESFRTFDSHQASGARACLDQLVSLDPTFALGWTYLTALHLREYLHSSGGADDVVRLERMLRAARRGVELNPASARAHEMLSAALFARHDVAAAFAAAEKAVTLNRYDMRIVGAFGIRKIAVGDIDAGMALLRRASGDGTVVPSFEQLFLFVGSYMRDDLERAAFHASQITSDTFELGLMARVLMSRRKGDGEALQAAVDRLVALNPLWRQNPRGALEKFFYADAIVGRLVADLSAAGLSTIN
jgi:TolB-like protein